MKNSKNLIIGALTILLFCFATSKTEKKKETICIAAKTLKDSKKYIDIYIKCGFSVKHIESESISTTYQSAFYSGGFLIVMEK